MPRQDISLLSSRELALTVLSKLLYHIATKSVGMAEIVSHHKNILQHYINQGISHTHTSDITEFSIYDIPWGDILDAIASKNNFLSKQIHTHQFSTHEIRYMCALLCGLSGKEYGLITGFKSHYNLSWSIRNKFGMPPKSTNLRIFLQKLSDSPSYESSSPPIPN